MISQNGMNGGTHLIVDGHADLLWEMSKCANDQARKQLGAEVVAAWQEQQLELQVLPVFVEPLGSVPEQWQAVCMQISYVYELLAGHPNLRLITDREAFLAWENARAQQADGIAVLLALEGCDSIQDVPWQKLTWLHSRGVRMLGITWNPANDFADGAFGSRHDGLSDLGRELVAWCERAGIILDTAHLSENAFWDLYACAQKPFVNTHSNTYKEFQHPRNLTDKQVTALIEKGGLLGLNMVPFLLAENMPDDASQAYDLWACHMHHVLALGGEYQIGFGSDLWGAAPMLSALKDVHHWDAFLKRLRSDKTLKEEQLELICSENWRSFLRNNLIESGK